MPEKEKRKNDEDMRTLGQNLWRYGVVVPLKGIWRYGIVMPTQGAWRATKAIFRWSWQATQATARWSWMALKWTIQSPFKWAWQATLWTLNLPLRIFDWIFGIHPPEHLSASQKAAYVRIKRYYRRRNRLIAHSFFYGMGWVVTLAQIYSLWQRSQEYGINLSSGIGATMAFISVWTLMIAFHYIRVRMSDSEDTALAQVLEHGGGQDYRRKRGDLVYHEIYDDEAEVYADEIAYRHLTDDGEFADDAPDYTDEQANRRRRS